MKNKLKCKCGGTMLNVGIIYGVSPIRYVYYCDKCEGRVEKHV